MDAALRSGRLCPGAALLLATISGCEAIDPTNINNPITTDDDLARAVEPTKSLLPGLRAQFARMTSAYVTAGDVISDNYSVHGTGLHSGLDNPGGITPAMLNSSGTSATGLYWNTQELRALSDFVIDVVAPEDTLKLAVHLAEAHYYRGMAFLTLGELFESAPHEEDGMPQSYRESLLRALRDFEEALPLGPRVSAATARAHRLLGDEAAAVADAERALAAEPDLLAYAEYDALYLQNTPYQFLVQRALQEMQPLPRLDFLDPKYTTRSAGIPVAKAEEMHLIVAEAALAAGDVQRGRERIAQAIEAASARDRISFKDQDERRNGDLTLRPRSPDMMVRADPESPFRAGLVLERPGVDLEVPHISATSLDADSVRMIGDLDGAWHALWLARQEIMFLEGRRLADLGIRLPVMLREIEQNPHMEDGDPGTQVVVPSWIPSGRGVIDAYAPLAVYDGDGADAQPLTREITVTVDLNRLLARSDASPFLRANLSGADRPRPH